MKVVHELMGKNKINKELRLKIKEFVKYKNNEDKNQNYEAENKILGCLPDHLRNEFFLRSYKEIFMENPLFFMNFNKNALFATMTTGVLKEQKYSPGDVIFDVFFLILLNL